MRELCKLVIIISSMVLMSAQMNGQIGIGANTFTPDNSALLELQSTNSGLLLPRMTTAQRDAISNPAQSLIIYNLTTKCVEIYESNQWQAIWCDCIGFSVTASASPATICSGSSSTLTASGANTYSWSGGLGTGASKTITPSSTTTYTVTGTSTAGCTGTATVSVTVNPLPSVTATASPSAICNGESSVLTASGANTYSWSGGLGSGASKTVTPSTTTTYTVTGTSTAGCTGTATVFVTVNPLPTVTASASPSTINSGQSSVLSASGASTYSWSHSLGSGSSKTVTPSSTTTYSVTGTSTANCTNTATVTVTVNTFTCGTSTVTYDGVTYNTVQIGDQCWLKENLRTTKYNDGTSITNITNNSTWASTITGAYCCYSNSTSNCSTYGALYNWYAVNTGKLCPSGWHVPSDAEWTTLTNYLSANSTYWCGSNSSYIAKSLASTTSWNSSTTTCAVGNNLSANNSTGFSALPGGDRGGRGGSFDKLGDFGYWWSSTEHDGSIAWYRMVNYGNADVTRDNDDKRHGFSVRCLRD